MKADQIGMSFERLDYIINSYPNDSIVMNLQNSSNLHSVQPVAVVSLVQPL